MAGYKHTITFKRNDYSQGNVTATYYDTSASATTLDKFLICLSAYNYDNRLPASGYLYSYHGTSGANFNVVGLYAIYNSTVEGYVLQMVGNGTPPSGMDKAQNIISNFTDSVSILPTFAYKLYDRSDTATQQEITKLKNTSIKIIKWENSYYSFGSSSSGGGSSGEDDPSVDYNTFYGNQVSQGDLRLFDQTLYQTIDSPQSNIAYTCANFFPPYDPSANYTQEVEDFYLEGQTVLIYFDSATMPTITWQGDAVGQYNLYNAVKSITFPIRKSAESSTNVPISYLLTHTDYNLDYFSDAMGESINNLLNTILSYNFDVDSEDYLKIVICSRKTQLIHYLIGAEEGRENHFSETLEQVGENLILPTFFIKRI